MITFRTSLFFLFLAIFSSCVPVSRIAYVQEENKPRTTNNIYIGPAIDSKIKPGDEIYVRINSADEEPTNLFTDGQGNAFNQKFMSYTVTEDGHIKLPYIGRVKLAGLSIEDASDYIEESLSQYLFLPSVYVRFVNSTVTVLGEVNRPGVYMFDYKNINILQAIGYAGDIGEFGNRKKVLVIRHKGSEKEKKYIDVTRADLFESEWYVLKSGDVVFVEPLSRKKWGMATVPYNLILTMVSTGILIYTVVAN